MHCKNELKRNKNVNFLSESSGWTEICSNDCEKIRFAVSNHDDGDRCVFAHFKHKKNITLDFNNAEWTIKNLITPVILNGCKNVVLKNLSIKFSRSYYVQTKIIRTENGAVVCEPTDVDLLRVQDGVLSVDYGDETLSYADLFFVQEFEAEFKVAASAKIASYAGKNKRYFELKNGLLYFYADLGGCKEGNYLCFFAQKRTADAILIHNCCNIKLQDIRIYSSPAMGVMCQTSRNIELENVCVEKDAGSVYQITSLADAAHFFACKGRVKMLRCVFENMNDDAANVHGIYESVESVCGQRVILCKKHEQQCGVNAFAVGDRVAVLDGKTKRTVCKAKITESVMLDRKRTQVTVDKAIPHNGAFLMENLSANPRVHIKECRTGNNRPRGFLLASRRKTVVEKCVFYNSECGVGSFADTDYWYESGAFGSITIADCTFRSNYGGGASAIEVAPTVRYDGRYFNGKLTVKRNRFERTFQKAISVSNTRKVRIIGNRGIKNPAEAIKITDCGKTVVRQ